MKFFVDNNLSVHLAHGLKEFGEDVTHLQDLFPEDAKDEEWLPYVGREGFFLVTRDENIRRKPEELRALKAAEFSAFFLGGKNLSRCKLIQQVVRSWPQIKKTAEKKRRPFAFRIAPNGGKFVKIEL